MLSLGFDLRVRTLTCHLTLVVSLSAMAEDWPQFRGANRNGISASSGLLSHWPEAGPPLVWQAQGAGRGYSSVAISDGRLFTTGDGPSTSDDADEYLSCFDVASGELLWQTRLGPPWNKGQSSWQGSRSTPTVDGDRVYAMTPFGELVCASARDGQEIWRRSLKDDFAGKKGDPWGYSESVLIDGQHVVCTPGGEENTMVALDALTGELAWSASAVGDRGAGHASIMISYVGRTKIYVQTTASGALGVTAEDGRVAWTYPVPKKTAIIPTPIILSDQVFIAAGYGLGGALLQQTESEPGVVGVEEVYPPNSKLQNKHGGIVLLNGYLYGDTDARGTPFCAELATGDIRWRERGSGRGSAAIAAADGHLYLRFKNGRMVLARVSAESYQEVGSFDIPGAGDRPSWSHPAIADGRLYLREDDAILCYDVRR